MYFSYKAKTSSGTYLEGLIEAPSASMARSMLRSQGHTILHIDGKSFKTHKILDDAAQLLFLKNLYQLLKSSIPLFEALSMMEEEAQGEKIHSLLVFIVEEVKRGNPFSAALKKVPGVLDPLFIPQIAAGERVGKLAETVGKICTFLEKRIKLKNQIQSALIYPIILGSFALFVVGMLIGFVVPMIEGIFEGRQLTGITWFVFAFSHFVRNHGSILLVVCILEAAFVLYAKRQPILKKKLDIFLWKIPFISALLAETAYSRFSGTLSALLEGGVPLVEALEKATELVDNPDYRLHLERMKESVQEGLSLSYQFKRQKIWPPIFGKMVAIGEESGSLAEVLKEISSYFEERVEKRLFRLTTLLQPLILLVLGGIIALVMLAVMIPLTQMSQF